MTTTLRSQRQLLRPQTLRPLSIRPQQRTFAISPGRSGPRVIETITTDHRELEMYFNRIVSSTDPTEQAGWQNQFTWELARHSVGEELVVYPAFERHLKDGVAMAEKDRGEHQGVSPISPLCTPLPLPD
jgi:hypothetical protein